MATEKQIEANRRNALRSTGPKTPEGKRSSSRNALTHGLTARAAVLPGEDAAEYEARRADWHADHPAADRAGRALIDRAFLAVWRLERCARHEVAEAGKRTRDAADVFLLAQRTRVEELGQLISLDYRHDPYTQRPDPALIQFGHRQTGAEPAAILLELESTVPGCDWLIRQWGRLGAMLEATGAWTEAERDRAIRLLGRRPGDVEQDVETARVFRAFGALDRGLDLSSQISGVIHRCGGSSSWERVKWIADHKPEPGEALAFLRALVRAEQTRLVDRRLDLLPRHEADLAEAADRALIDDTQAGARARRYESDHERELHRAVRDLVMLGKANPAAVVELEEEESGPAAGPELGSFRETGPEAGADAAEGGAGGDDLGCAASGGHGATDGPLAAAPPRSEDQPGPPAEESGPAGEAAAVAAADPGSGSFRESGVEADPESGSFRETGSGVRPGGHRRRRSPRPGPAADPSGRRDRQSGRAVA